ncbi:MAG: histidine--tRNA ligase [Candidatus Krumholzibacteria bacterium]|nr:histidine--tRNA ligase [Candidatus Krumholzibacteria bacterium]
MKFARPRGTNDIFGEQAASWRRVENALAVYLRSCGYREIRTPIFESTELFVRAVGEATDIVTKEMYTFADRKGRSLTLRPENTAPVMRAYLENGLYRGGGVARFYYIGPMFRYDRPQAGRFRQFHQIGIEALGSGGPAIDAEIIDVSIGLYRVLGFPPLEVRLNSVGCAVCRSKFREVLTASLIGFKGGLCDSCRERMETNPLRIFDCKECSAVKEKLPVITDHLCGECSDHFIALQGILTSIGIRYVLDPLLVRGLDYYTRTAFEILHPFLGAQNALCGGGRYDGLAEDCGGPRIPAIGFSAGLERLMEVLPGESDAARHERETDVCFAVLDEASVARSLSLARELRDRGLSVVVDLSGRTIKKQLKGASDAGAALAVIVGLAELEPGTVALKKMKTGEQRPVRDVALIAETLKEMELTDE